MPQNFSKKKLLHLDGLRGLAAIIVVFHHLVLIFYPNFYSGEKENTLAKIFATSPLNLFYNGDFAVCLFFVLSGYVLSYKYVLSNNIKILPGYFIKRYFRLLPIIALSVVVCYFCVLNFTLQNSNINNYTHSGEWLLTLFDFQPGLKSLLKNIVYGVLIFGENQYNPVVWSMKLEFFGSLLLFAFLFVNHFIRPKWVLLLVFVGVLFWLKEFYYISFLGGYYLCYLNTNNKLQIKKLWLKILLFLSAVFLSSYPASHNFINESIYAVLLIKQFDLYSFYHIVGSMVFLHLISQSKAVVTFLCNKSIQFLGKISFSLYLFHLLFLLVITGPLFIQLHQTMGYNLAVGLAVLITLPFIFLLSYFTNKFVDVYAIKLANKVGAAVNAMLKTT